MRHNPSTFAILQPGQVCLRILLGMSVAALLMHLSACGPRFSPRGPGDDPSTGRLPARPASSQGSEPARPAQPASGSKIAPLGRQVLIGEMCPRAAGGRPAVLPVFLRALDWSADSDDVSLPIERRAARSFSVFSWDGRRAGVFSVAGAADVGLERKAAIGAYAGDSPCAVPTAASPQMDAACVRAQAECGLAVAVIEPDNASRPYEEDPDPAELPVAGACLAGDKLLVDIDADGVLEAYVAESFMDPGRIPAEEVLAVPIEGATCAPVFAQEYVIPPKDPKHFGGLDLAGVMDLDADGRNELILVYHYADRRTWAVYSAAQTAARLELASESVPWAAP